MLNKSKRNRTLKTIGIATCVLFVLAIVIPSLAALTTSDRSSSPVDSKIAMQSEEEYEKIKENIDADVMEYDGEAEVVTLEKDDIEIRFDYGNQEVYINDKMLGEEFRTQQFIPAEGAQDIINYVKENRKNIGEEMSNEETSTEK